MYRRREKGSKKYNERLARAREARERKRLEAPAPDYPPELPELRREIVVRDFDFGEVEHVICLYRANRVDCYRVEVDGKCVARRMGWSRVLELLRKAFLRVARW